MKRDCRRCLALILAVLMLVTVFPVVWGSKVNAAIEDFPEETEDTVDAVTKHYPDTWSTYNFDTKGRGFDDEKNRNKGYYISPKG